MRGRGRARGSGGRVCHRWIRRERCDDRLDLFAVSVKKCLGKHVVFCWHTLVEHTSELESGDQGLCICLGLSGDFWIVICLSHDQRFLEMHQAF